MKSAAASSTSLVVMPGRTKSLTRSRISLAVRHACRIFSISLAFLIGIIACPQLTARYRQRLPRDHGCRRSDAVLTSFYKRRPMALSYCGTLASEFATRLDHRRYAALADHRNKDIRDAPKTARSTSWL